jgi:hypothetical protein
MKEKMTIYELIVLANQNFDAIVDIQAEMVGITLADATIEWAKRNGRDIEIVPSKVNHKDFCGISV